VFIKKKYPLFCENYSLADLADYIHLIVENLITDKKRKRWFRLGGRKLTYSEMSLGQHGSATSEGPWPTQNTASFKPGPFCGTNDDRKALSSKTVLIYNP